jgi:hypothetical protein
MTDHKMLERSVRLAFQRCQVAAITHGFPIILVEIAEQVLFEMRGPSGGVALGFTYYLKTNPPPAYPKTSAITNAVGVRYEDNDDAISASMAREIARLQGFAEALVGGWSQPTITNMDGGDLGIPWRLGGQYSRNSEELIRFMETKPYPKSPAPEEAKIINIEVPKGS